MAHQVNDILPHSQGRQLEELNWTKQGIFRDKQGKEWVLTNQKEFPSFITREFKQHQITETTQEQHGEEGSSNDTSMMPHQSFVYEYMKWGTPYRGLMLDYGLGSGKTRAAIEVTETFVQQGIEVFVFLPASLKSNFLSEIRRWTKQPSFQLPSDYSSMSPVKQELTLEQVNRKIQTFYHFISYNASNVLDQLARYGIGRKTSSIPSSQYNRLENIARRHGYKELNPPTNKVIVIDEMHNLVNGMSNPTSKVMRSLYFLFMECVNCKLITLTGTPIINSPFEIALHLNLLRGKIYDKQGMTHSLFPDNPEQFYHWFFDFTQNKMKNETLFQHRILGITSYYPGIKETTPRSIFPEVIRHYPDTNLPRIVYIPMSPEQKSAYLETYYDESKRMALSLSSTMREGQSSTYFIKSRILCNYFLKDIQKPSNDMSKIKRLIRWMENIIQKERNQSNIPSTILTRFKKSLTYLKTYQRLTNEILRLYIMNYLHDYLSIELSSPDTWTIGQIHEFAYLLQWTNTYPISSTQSEEDEMETIPDRTTYPLFESWRQQIMKNEQYKEGAWNTLLWISGLILERDTILTGEYILQYIMSNKNGRQFHSTIYDVLPRDIQVQSILTYLKQNPETYLSLSSLVQLSPKMLEMYKVLHRGCGSLQLMDATTETYTPPSQIFTSSLTSSSSSSTLEETSKQETTEEESSQEGGGRPPKRPPFENTTNKTQSSTSFLSTTASNAHLIIIPIHSMDQAKNDYPLWWNTFSVHYNELNSKMEEGKFPETTYIKFTTKNASKSITNYIWYIHIPSSDELTEDEWVSYFSQWMNEVSTKKKIKRVILFFPPYLQNRIQTFDKGINWMKDNHNEPISIVSFLPYSSEEEEEEEPLVEQEGVEEEEETQQSTLSKEEESLLQTRFEIKWHKQQQQKHTLEEEDPYHDQTVYSSSTVQGGPSFIYSNFKTLEGVGIFSLILQSHGYEEFRPSDYSLHEIETLPPKPRYAFITGGQFKTEMEREKLITFFNHERNKHGQLIRVLLGTQAAAEGISLKHVRQVLIMESHWNQVRIEQVIGRSARIASHSDLPFEERKVNVYYFFMDVDYSVDERLWQISQRKEDINQRFIQNVRQASVNCQLHQKHHSLSSCITFPPHAKGYTYYPSLKESQEKQMDIRTQQKTLSWTADRKYLVDSKNPIRFVVQPRAPIQVKRVFETMDTIEGYRLYSGESYVSNQTIIPVHKILVKIQNSYKAVPDKFFTIS